MGPSLAALARRKAGTLAGFKYTTALRSSGLTWDDHTFDQFMIDPAKKVPGTAMAVMLPDAAVRANLFACLERLKDERASAPSQAATPPAAPTIKRPSQADLDDAQASTQHWLYASHDYSGTRYVPLGQIKPSNAASLRPVCTYRSEQAAPTQTTPLVYDGTMYLTFVRATVVIDAATCRERWTHVWQPKGHEISTTNHQGRAPRARHGGRLSHRPRQGNQHPVVEPRDRERGVEPVRQRADADLPGPRSDRPGGCPTSAPRTGWEPSSSRAESRSGGSISFPTLASRGPRPGPDAAASKHGGGSI